MKDKNSSKFSEVSTRLHDIENSRQEKIHMLKEKLNSKE